MLWQMVRSPVLAVNTFPGVVYIKVSFDNSILVRETYFGIATALEEMGSPDKTNIVIPHDNPFLVLAGDFECVLEDYTNL